MKISWEVKVIQKHQYQHDRSLLGFREGSMPIGPYWQGRFRGEAELGLEEIVGFKERTAMWVRFELASVFSVACGHPHTL